MFIDLIRGYFESRRQYKVIKQRLEEVHGIKKEGKCMCDYNDYDT